MNKIYYFGPTMGKTTLAKTNSNVVDFDDVIREESIQIANKLGISVRTMKCESRKAYLDLIDRTLDDMLINPKYNGKIIMVSVAHSLRRPEIFTYMAIPSVSVFMARNKQRGLGGTRGWYDALMKKYGGKELLTIDNRFVSEILNL